jgi:copper transport protein
MVWSRWLVACRCRSRWLIPAIIVFGANAQPVPGHPDELRVRLGPLPNGAYTVAWRTVSRVDGHVTGGAFAFGIGISPAAVPRATASSPPASFGIVIARWGWYVGLASLFGATWTWAAAVHGGAVTFRYLWLGWAMAFVSLVGLGFAQASDAGTSLGRLLMTPLGSALYERGAPLIAAGLLIAAVRGGSRDRQRIALAGGGVCTAAAMLAHVLAGHAGAGSGPWRPANVADQWVHFMGVGIWMGGGATFI